MFIQWLTKIFPEKTTFVEDHPIASWSSESSQWDQANHQLITKDYHISAPYRMSASALMLGSRGNRPCGFCYSIMNKCYWCLYHAVFLTIVIIKKIIRPGKVPLYSHARKDAVSSEKLESNFLLSSEDQAPDAFPFPDHHAVPVTLEAQMQPSQELLGPHPHGWSPNFDFYFPLFLNFLLDNFFTMGMLSCKPPQTFLQPKG